MDDDDDPKQALIALLIRHEEAQATTSAGGQRQDTRSAAMEEQRLMLQGLKVKELRRKAKGLGLDEDAVDDTIDEDDPKAAMIDLIIKALEHTDDEAEEEPLPMRLRGSAGSSRSSAGGSIRKSLERSSSANEEAILREETKAALARKKEAKRREHERHQQEEDERWEREQAEEALLEEEADERERAERRSRKQRQMDEDRYEEEEALSAVKGSLGSKGARLSEADSQAEQARQKKEDQKKIQAEMREAKSKREGDSPRERNDGFDSGEEAHVQAQRKAASKEEERQARRSMRKQLGSPPSRASPRPKGGLARRTGGRNSISGRQWLEENVYPTVHPALVALDRCRPHDFAEEVSGRSAQGHVPATLYPMTPARFLARCLMDSSFLHEASEATIDMSATNSLLTFMEGKWGSDLPASYRVDEILRSAVHQLSKTRPEEPLRAIADRLNAA